MMGFPGGMELFVILLIVLILFGGKKLPELMGGIGKGIKSFKKGINDPDPIEDSAEVLGSDRMTDRVTMLKNRYTDRFIIFDAPPILSGADVIAFAPIVDGILFVVESGKTSIKDVKKAVDLVPFDKLLGFVLNRHKVKKNYYRKYSTN